MAYTLTLTADDWKAIHFVGHRYHWSEALGKYFNGGTVCHDEDCDMSEGTHRIRFTEADAWELREAFEADTEGGHSVFPMLDLRSALYAKLTAFLGAIV